MYDRAASFNGTLFIIVQAASYDGRMFVEKIVDSIYYLLFVAKANKKNTLT